jgi:hypothetical protein
MSLRAADKNEKGFLGRIVEPIVKRYAKLLQNGFI